MTLGDFEDVVGLGAVGGVGIVVDEVVVFIYHLAEAVRLTLVDAEVSLLEFRFEHKELQIFFIFGVRIVLNGVLGHDDGALEVIAAVCAEVVVKLCVLQLLERELVLKLEDGLLSYGNFVAAREVVKEALQLLYSLQRGGLVELGVGRVEIVSVATVIAGELGVFAFGIAGVVHLEVGAGGQIVTALEFAQSQEIKTLLAFIRTLEHCAALFEQRDGLDVFLLLEGSLRIVEFIVVILALKRVLVFAAGSEGGEQQQWEQDAR